MNAFVFILIVIAVILTGFVIWARSLPPVGRAEIVITGTETSKRPVSAAREDFVPEPLDG